MSRLLPILLGVTITILVRCESPAPWPTSGVFVGYYAFGFERSDFKPAGTAERWWLSGNISTLKQEKGRNPAYVVIRGTLSAEGRHGHLGNYSRELRVDEILDVRALQPDERIAF